MNTINEKITIGKADRLEIDITSTQFKHGWTRLDWGWNELRALGEENRNGCITFTENRLESALRAYLVGVVNAPVGEFKWTWDKYSK
jgi:hypothetical protein